MKGLLWVIRKLVGGASCTRTWNLLIESSMGRGMAKGAAPVARQPAALQHPRHQREGRRACPPSPPLRAG